MDEGYFSGCLLGFAVVPVLTWSWRWLGNTESHLPALSSLLLVLTNLPRTQTHSFPLKGPLCRPISRAGWEHRGVQDREGTSILRSSEGPQLPIPDGFPEGTPLCSGKSFPGRSRGKEVARQAAVSSESQRVIYSLLGGERAGDPEKAMGQRDLELWGAKGWWEKVSTVGWALWVTGPHASLISQGF